LSEPTKKNVLKQDPTAVSRKRDHIELAFKSAVAASSVDDRFYYEPMLAGHPTDTTIPSTAFAGFDLRLPIWVSSMTGGTEWASTINTNLAKACGQYGMGMGLGSCRSLLFDDDRLSEFAVKPLMPDQPLYANLGIAQLEELYKADDLAAVGTLIGKLDADGLIVHVNPLQEWLQPEGDRYYMSPIELVKRLIDAQPHMSIIVKEVGQGFGPRSMAALYELPIAAVDFAASGGTNFALLELLRSSDQQKELYSGLSKVGHSNIDMVHMAADILANLPTGSAVPSTIVSGGVKDYLDGYHLIQKLGGTAIYGQASAFLAHARDSYELLQQHVEGQMAGLQVAYSFLTVK